ncbi:MAG: copper homeostasis protein CutC [Saprospiraceae bacterium]
MPAKLEVACFDLPSAHIALQAGAHRIEFCTDRAAGGLTPDLTQVQALRQQTATPLYAMVRPVGGGFVYAPAAFQAMRQTIIDFKSAGVDGLVFGILDAHGQVDAAANRELVTLAHPLPCTFHRAFDQVSDPLQAVETVIDCGFQTLLTSAGAPTAIEGLPLLQQLVAQAQGRIHIMPGGGVRAAHISALHTALQVPFYHTAAITPTSDPLPDAAEIASLLQSLQ